MSKELSEIYVDACFKQRKGKIAVTDSSGNVILTKLYSNPCCIKRLELEAIIEGCKVLNSKGIIHSDNQEAIREAPKVSDISVVYVKGKHNKADRPSKITRAELIIEAPELPSCFHFIRPKKVKKWKNEREYWYGKEHMMLIKMTDGSEQWLTVSKFRKYQRWIIKNNKKN